MREPALRGVVICPSNPYLSIDPILAVPGLKGILRESKAPVVAVSPLVGGEAIKGPTAKIMGELGVPQTTIEVARHYGDLLSGSVLDEQDAELESEIRDLGIKTVVAQTVMVTFEDKSGLARSVLDFINTLAS